MPDKHYAIIFDIDDMEPMAKSVVVRLAATEKGLKLVESESEHVKDG